MTAFETHVVGLRVFEQLEEQSPQVLVPGKSTVDAFQGRADLSVVRPRYKHLLELARSLFRPLELVEAELSHTTAQSHGFVADLGIRPRHVNARKTLVGSG